MFDSVRDRLEQPTARGLAQAVSTAVGDGVLESGAKLPPIRTVAIELGLSPTTVSAAWALLARSGTIHTDGRRGTMIAVNRTPGPTRYRRALAGSAVVDLSTGVPDPALLPDLAPALGRLRADAPQTYLDEPVVFELAEFLRDDWPFVAEALTIVDGAMDALDLLCAQLLRYGDRVAVEHPCFPPLLDLLDAAGAQIVPVDVDNEGPVPGQLQHAIDSGARVLILQPRGQNPTGASLSPKRAAALAGVLAARDVLVIENDSAGAVASSPLISLGQWLPDRTVHIRSFSKSHGPDLRLAAVGGASIVVGPLVERRHLGQGWSSRLLQRLLLDLLTQTESVTQVRNARAEYARRRQQIVTDLARFDIVVGGLDGLNIWLPVVDEATALVSLASSGIGAAPGAPFAARPGMAPHLRVTAGLVTGDAAEFARIAAALAAASGVRWSAPR